MKNLFKSLRNLLKSKNVREQRAKVFGTDANAPRTSDKRRKMMTHLKDYAQRKYGLNVRTAAGKRDPNTGELREKKPMNAQPFDVYSKEGVEKEKALMSALNEKNVARKAKGLKKIPRVDPKPDWRNKEGFLESQPSPDALVHEMAHINWAPEGMPLPEIQTDMDQRHIDNQKKYGYMQNKRTAGEIQPMALENPLRREVGLPANRTTKPVKQYEATHDFGTPRFVEGKDKKGQTAYYDRQSRLMHPETRERLEQIREGSLKFNPQKGWEKPNDINATINLRGRGQKEEAEKRLRTRSAPKMKMSEKPLLKPYSSDAQRRWAHTQAGTKALGGKAYVHEWDESTKGKKLPEHVAKSESVYFMLVSEDEINGITHHLCKSDNSTIHQITNKDGTLIGSATITNNEVEQFSINPLFKNQGFEETLSKAIDIGKPYKPKYKGPQDNMRGIPTHKLKQLQQDNYGNPDTGFEVDPDAVHQELGIRADKKGDKLISKYKKTLIQKPKRPFDPSDFDL